MATGNMYRKFGEIWTCVLRYASGQTDKQTDRQRQKQTDTLITILCLLSVVT